MEFAWQVEADSNLRIAYVTDVYTCTLIQDMPRYNQYK